MNSTSSYVGVVVGPSYIYNYDNNSIVSLLEIQIDGKHHTTIVAIPEYLNRQADIPIFPGYKVAIIVDVNGHVIDFNILETNATSNNSFYIYPNICPVCNTPLTRVVYHHGVNRPYIARICFSKSCLAFMYNNTVKMLQALQLDIDYTHITSVLESAINSGKITHCGEFFEYLIVKPHELLIGNMDRSKVDQCSKALRDKFRGNFLLVHILQLLNIALLEDIQLVTQLCSNMPLLVTPLVDVNPLLLKPILAEFIRDNQSSNIFNIANSIYTFLNTHKNEQTLCHLTKLIQVVQSK